MKRILLYNKDLQLLTGKSERTCYRLLHKIKKSMGKAIDSPITISEFCAYMEIRPETVLAQLK